MKNYDAIVIGGGLTGSALGYELAKQKLKVLLIEKDRNLVNATKFSYGGIAYWCGTDEFISKISHEAIEIHRHLSEELEHDTEFKELDLLFTIDRTQNIEEVEKAYQAFHIQPELLDVQQTVEIEPLINPGAIAGSLRFPQGHVNPLQTILAYQKAFLRLGGEIAEEEVTEFITQQDQVTGVVTPQNRYTAQETIVSAGAYSRQLLQKLEITLPIYFSHAQLIKTKPSDIKLSTIVMPATTKRLDTEKQVAQMDKDCLWENPTDEVYGDVLEAGGVQFADGSFCLGQISQIITNINATIDRQMSEERIREAVSKVLPDIGNLEGQWYNCQIAFTSGMPFQVGAVSPWQGLSLFSGFTSPFVFVPPLAKRMTKSILQGDREMILDLSN